MTLNSIRKAFYSFLICPLFEHKLSPSIMAYSISTRYMEANIKIYKISKCIRCEDIVCIKVDDYDMFGSCPQCVADEEEKKLRERGVVSIVEAYKKIEEGECYGSFGSKSGKA